MAAAAGARKTVSIHDYPEHLNPFREDDNHNKIRFWTISRKLSRTNSISFSGIKDLKNSWALRSFMKKGKRGQDSSSQEKQKNQINGDTSPIVYRRAMQYSSSSMSGARSTVGSPERADRYVYGGSVTPLPRSRFQERLRSSSQNEVNSICVSPRMARSEVSGSRLSVESTNPFEDGPVPPIRAPRRKKKRAPLPPSATHVADTEVLDNSTELHITENKEKGRKIDGDLEIDEMNLNIELKIVEDEDEKHKLEKTVPSNTSPAIHDTIKENIILNTDSNGNETELIIRDDDNIVRKPTENLETTVKNSELKDNNHASVPFPKVDIVKYRRNSSVNDDDIRLRRGNLEDFHPLSTKRSKSLTNTSDSSYVTYDINLNESDCHLDNNDNEEPQKVVCKLTNTPRKESIDTISSTEREFQEIDKVTRDLEKEINKLNAAIAEDDFSQPGIRVSDIRRKFDKPIVFSPNPIPKPRRSNCSEPSSPVNGNVTT